ncbi:hypothetical protein WN944_026849 [Citrus x changshan-huyou]|uniref:Uncharacterized protein n=1 Tax=Citrus x changshan-huyou TaxID=2935761 RepID=A0AAP0Q7Y9_9ROSI
MAYKNLDFSIISSKNFYGLSTLRLLDLLSVVRKVLRKLIKCKPNNGIDEVSKDLDFLLEPAKEYFLVKDLYHVPLSSPSLSYPEKAHESERYVECADTPELAVGTTGWCLTAPQAKFKLRVGFASGVGGEGWWVEICGCSLGFRDCSSFCSDMSLSQDEA